MPAEVPDPELAEHAKRRTFTAKYKLRILQEADACTKPGEVGELLRRERLYTSHLTYWRKQRKDGALKELGRRLHQRTREDPRAPRRLTASAGNLTNDQQATRPPGATSAAREHRQPASENRPTGTSTIDHRSLPTPTADHRLSGPHHALRPSGSVDPG